MTLYLELKAAGCRIAHHESDMYVLANDKSRALIREAVRTKRLAHYPTLFVSQHPEDNGALWYEIRFAYAPFWDRGQSCATACAAAASADYAELSREHMARYPKIRSRLAE